MVICGHYDNNEINRFGAILVSQKHPDSVSINLICIDGKVGASVFLGAFLSMVKMSNLKNYAYT